MKVPTLILTLRAFAFATVLAGCAVAAAADAPPPIPVRVLVINMFQPEAAPWLEALHAGREIAVPGLPEEYPAVRCNSDAVCQMTTGMGHANAAASLMAVLYSGRFDLHQAYFLIAGIAGIDPAQGTIGTAAWARWAVDTGIAHEIDARELPRGWDDGYFGVLTESPEAMPKLEYRSEVFRLNEALAQRAFALSKTAVLADSDALRRYRAHYPSAPANQPPTVALCDTVSADTWWTGARLGNHARHWVKLLTGGDGVYCTTQQEDNATLLALTRAAHSGLIDFQRIAVLRSGSDFDRPYPHQGVLAGLHAQLQIADAFHLATVNLERAGLPLVEEIAQHWERWQSGVPGTPAP
jgi:purine nucleoside permease